MLDMHSRVSRPIALFLLIMLAFIAVAQNPVGRISGVIQDPSGAVVPNASIVVTNEATNVKYTATGSAEGGFVVPSVPAGTYTVEISAAGFATASYKEVKVDPGKEYSLTAKLTLSSSKEVVEVTAGQELVNTTTTEVSNTVNINQVQNLPLNGRDIISLVGTQAGVNYNGRTATTINGSRPSWSQVTLDGINIQDLFIRTNALDYIPNRPTTDTVAEFTVNTGTQGADAALGSSGVRMVTPSGTNAFHGSVYEYNRNSALTANDWMNKFSGVDKPFYNRNEFGATLGGPAIKNKLFFYGYYTGLRTRQKAQLYNTIPAYDDYLQGNFRYVPVGGGPVQVVNVLNPALNTNSKAVLTIDPVIANLLKAIPSASNVNNFLTGNSSPTRLLNTAGFLRLQSSNNDRDNYGFKVDFEASSTHHFDFTYSHMHELTQRPSYDPVNVVPEVNNDSSPKLFSGSWRWTAMPTLINTFRMGANLVNAPFIVSGDNPLGNYFLAVGSVSSSSTTMSGIGISPPYVSFRNQGRTPAVHQYMDDANWVKGNHNFSFGGQFQQQNLYTYDFAGTVPTYTMGFSTAAPANYALTSANFPTAISSSNLTSANNLRAFLSGVISSATQNFNVATPTSGYVAGQPNGRNLRMNDYMFYGTDRWRLLPNLTITYGVKWEYVSPYNEINGLQLGPVYGVDAVASLFNPNGVVGFMKEAYKKDRNNFGPTAGFAWDPFKDGKTSIRGGYTLTFVNDDLFRFAGNAADGNAGLSSTVTKTGLFATLNGGIPTVATPTFSMPRTFADQLSLGLTNVVWALDPKVHTPVVHEFSFGIERELPHEMAVSARYVGTLGRDLLRGMDLNQNSAGTNAAYLADFARARSNGFLAQAAGLGFDPNYNASVSGSQQLTYISNITAATGTNLTNTNVVGYIQQNAAAELANYWITQRTSTKFTNAPSLFLPNPGIYAIDFGTNGSSSDYHSLQLEAKRRMKNGLQWQANYVWSKLLANSPAGSGQTRFDPFLDNARPYLAKSRAEYDLRHTFKTNVVYELPFGKGKMFGSSVPSVLDKIIGGWQISGIYNWQSGNPFSILSNRGTFNRGGRSTYQTAFSLIPQNQIQKYIGMYKDSDGQLWWINPSIVDPNTGMAVMPDNANNTPSTAFNQIFLNPVAGQVGNIGLLAFDSPATQNLDMGIAKATAITERVNITFRADFFNALNHPTFYFGDQEINNSQFGKIQYTYGSPRQIQFSLKLTF